MPAAGDPPVEGVSARQMHSQVLRLKMRGDSNWWTPAALAGNRRRCRACAGGTTHALYKPTREPRNAHKQGPNRHYAPAAALTQNQRPRARRPRCRGACAPRRAKSGALATPLRQRQVNSFKDKLKEESEPRQGNAQSAINARQLPCALLGVAKHSPCCRVCDWLAP
jgi:hypothetical protein